MRPREDMLPGLTGFELVAFAAQLVLIGLIPLIGYLSGWFALVLGIAFLLLVFQQADDW